MSNWSSIVALVAGVTGLITAVGNTLAIVLRLWPRSTELEEVHEKVRQLSGENNAGQPDGH